MNLDLLNDLRKNVQYINLYGNSLWFMSVLSESRIIIPFQFPIVIVCLISPLFKFWPRAGYSLFKKAGMLFTVKDIVPVRFPL